MTRIRHLYPQEMQKIAEAQLQPEPPGRADRSDQPSVTVVILSLDRLHLTRRCIDSVYANSDYPFKLLIWDNGSQAETITYLKELATMHDNARVIFHGKNVGCGDGRNRAFALVDTEYVFSLDNDMVCHAGWLRQTMACAVRHSADFIAPLRLNVDGSVWSACLELIHTAKGATSELARWFHDLPVSIVQSLLHGFDLPTNFVSGGLGLFSVQAFQACGGFDDSYQNGLEDIDFALRLNERGYRVWATAQAYLTHDDQWQPQSQADVQYARARYDLDRLQRDAERFKARWGVEVLPEKYVTSLQQRLDRKLSESTKSP